MRNVASFKRVGVAALALTMGGVLAAPGANALNPETTVAAGTEVCVDLALNAGVKAGQILEIDDDLGGVLGRVVVARTGAKAKVKVCVDADVDAEIEVEDLELLDDGYVVKVHVDTDLDAEVEVKAKVTAQALLGRVFVAAEVKAVVELEAEADLDVSAKVRGLRSVGGLLDLGEIF